MSWRFHGHARTDPTNPQAYAVCDRCSRWFNHRDLSWQFDFRGNQLTNLRFLVCRDCYDHPQDQLRPRILPPDPVPIGNPRPENFTADNEGISAETASQPPGGLPIPTD